MIRSRNSWGADGESSREVRPKINTVRTGGPELALFLKDAITASLARKKHEFTRLAWHLHEKKLDLAEAKRHYEREVR